MLGAISEGKVGPEKATNDSPSSYPSGGARLFDQLRSTPWTSVLGESRAYATGYPKRYRFAQRPPSFFRNISVRGYSFLFFFSQSEKAAPPDNEGSRQSSG